MFALDILLQVVGAFYMFAGIVLARAVLLDRMLEKARGVVAGSSPPAIARVRTWYCVGLAVLTYLSGLALMSLCDLAIHFFLLTLLLQAAFLFWIAPRFLDTPASAQSKGRAQSTNAFVIFMAATALVAWATSLGRLQAVEEADANSLLMTGGLIAIYLAYVLWLIVQTRVRRM